MATNPQTTQPLLFDRALQRRRWQRAAAQFHTADVLHRRVAADIADRLSLIERHFATAAVCGPGSFLAVDAIMASGKVGDTIDVVPTLPPAGMQDHTGAAHRTIVGDEERLPFGNGSLDLIVSLLSLQTVNDLPGALIQMRRALKPDGLLMAAVFGGQTLHELKSAFAVAESDLLGGVSPRIAPFADVRDLGGLLQRAGFALPVADTDTVVLTYDAPLKLLRDLRLAGCANSLHERTRRPMRRALLARTLACLQARAGDGVIRATFEIVTLTGWAPHASQQQALAPGSARARLAEALGTQEQKAGDTASPRSR